MEKRITYVGLDVHKDTIAVALTEAGKRGEVREYGKIANTASALQSLVSKLARGGHRLRFCYEAGPWVMGSSGPRWPRAPPLTSTTLSSKRAVSAPPDYRQGSLADRTAGSKICCCWVTKSGRSGPDVYG